MKQLLNFLSQYRLLTLLAIVVAIGSVVVLVFVGVEAAIFWSLVAMFLLKLGDRE